MPSPNLTLLDSPLGPYRDVFTQSIASADYVNANGFTVSGVAAGTLAVRTINGAADGSFPVAAGGSVVGPGGIPVICVAVRMNTTVGSIIVGIL